eukprot:ctg_433.g275
MVRAALGVPDLTMRVLDVRPWEMSAFVADRMAVGRVFLAGDAAHTMPPTGGLDSQTSMQDAADLAWKLALVLQHKAGPQLLDTYEMERHPVAEITVARQVANYVERVRPDWSELNAPGATGDIYETAGGYRYRSAAIISDGPDDGQPTEDPFHPTGRPGFRVPHVWLERDGVRISTLDLVGHEFVLFAGREGGAWAEAAHQTSSALGITVECFRIGVDLVDANSDALTRLGITESGASLVRPDGFVAWRCRDGDANAVDVLSDALQRLLFRNPRSCEASRPRAPSSHDDDYPMFPSGSVNRLRVKHGTLILQRRSRWSHAPCAVPYPFRHGAGAEMSQRRCRLKPLSLERLAGSPVLTPPSRTGHLYDADHTRSRASSGRRFDWPHRGHAPCMARRLNSGRRASSVHGAVAARARSAFAHVGAASCGAWFRGRLAGVEPT